MISLLLTQDRDHRVSKKDAMPPPNTTQGSERGRGSERSRESFLQYQGRRSPEPTPDSSDFLPLISHPRWTTSDNSAIGHSSTIATFCKGEKPKLRIIQDPMVNLHPAMLYLQVQYLVD
jgi:hypothetical protein